MKLYWRSSSWQTFKTRAHLVMTTTGLQLAGLNCAWVIFFAALVCLCVCVSLPPFPPLGFPT